MVGRGVRGWKRRESPAKSPRSPSPRVPRHADYPPRIERAPSQSIAFFGRRDVRLRRRIVRYQRSSGETLRIKELTQSVLEDAMADASIKIELKAMAAEKELPEPATPFLRSKATANLTRGCRSPQREEAGRFSIRASSGGLTLEDEHCGPARSPTQPRRERIQFAGLPEDFPAIGLGSAELPPALWARTSTRIYNDTTRAVQLRV